MKILLFGANGQVGYALTKNLGLLGDLVALTRNEIDLTDLSALKDKIFEIKPEIIINAAAYTAVDKAEDEPELAFAVNAHAVEVLATCAKSLGALLVHYSTDYVFDGTKTEAYLEKDTASPISVYGKSKLAGEEIIISSGCKHFIFRTSWVYSDRGHNFAKTILKLTKERDIIKIVNDQFGSPTNAELIAEKTVNCLKQYSSLDLEKQSEICGLYHLTANGKTSWHGFATYLIECTKKLKQSELCFSVDILPISTSEFGAKAHRPKNSCLCCDKIENIFGCNLPDWQIHVEKFIKNWIGG